MDERRRRSETLVEAALEILNTADPVEKARLGEAAATRWLEGAIALPYRPEDPPVAVPDRPARLSDVKLVPPQLMPKLGKGGSLQSRQAILHSLVHTESWAIDLSWDIIARFGQQDSMPKEFFTDFVKVAQDEGRHFTLLRARLQELGSFYGALPAHDGLWDSALHARGLDVLPTTISRFRNAGDELTAKLLETVVYAEEITHCAAGVKWFRYLCLRAPGGCENLAKVHEVGHGNSESIVECPEVPLRSSEGGEDAVIRTFHDTVRRYFRGPLKPPFNAQARDAAGFGPAWYEPLAVEELLKRMPS